MLCGFIVDHNVSLLTHAVDKAEKHSTIVVFLKVAVLLTKVGQSEGEVTDSSNLRLDRLSI